MLDKIYELADLLFCDPSVQRLVGSTATWEPLQICYPREVNVSRLLAWLLDPTQGHGLGDLPIQSLLSCSWANADQADLTLATRRFLAPSNIYTESFSSVLVTTEVELSGRSLDVLLLDVNRRRYIAVENKFGARQSKHQLHDYRHGLEKLLPGFLGVHIFLDSNEAEPDDASWIPVGYDWLVEFLRDVEQRPATAEHVRQTLAQFRSVIEDVAEDAVSSSGYGKLLTEISGNHQTVLLDVMKPWQLTAKAARPGLLASLLAGSGTLEGKAALRLFQLYWRRKPVWDHCIKQAQFAQFVMALRKDFPDLLIDPKRLRTSFSLQRWCRFVDKAEDDGYFYPAGVNVLKTGETFQVTSFLQLNDVRAEQRDRFTLVALQMREHFGVRRALNDRQSFLVMRRSKDLAPQEAVERACQQLHEVEAALKHISRSNSFQSGWT